MTCNATNSVFILNISLKIENIGFSVRQNFRINHFRSAKIFLEVGKMPSTIQ
jgi:hypothetical protein